MVLAFPDIGYGFYQSMGQAYTEIFIRKYRCGQIYRSPLRIMKDKRATVTIANPNAPTGLALPLSDIRLLLEQDKDRSARVV